MNPRLAVGSALAVAVLLATSATAAVAEPLPNRQPAVVPTLQHWTGGRGAITLKQTPIITANAGASGVARRLAEDLRSSRSTGCCAPEVAATSSPDGDIRLVLDSSKSSGKGGERFKREGYTLDIAADSVTITAPAERGLFYGTRSLIQLLRQSNDGRTLPRGSSEDWPSYPVRGFMLDVGRKFFTPQFIRDYISMMSWYKMNTFQIHLNDNEIKPDGGDFTKGQAGFRLASDNPEFAGLASIDGAYTRADWQSFEQAARDHGMDLVPEIGGPGHSASIIRWRPGIGQNGGNSDHLDLANPEATRTMKAIYSEFAPWFRNSWLHIGTDEYPKEFAGQYRDYLNSIAANVRTLGKTPVAWGSASKMQGNANGYDRGIIQSSWNDDWYSLRQAHSDGFQVINMRDEDLYVVPYAEYYHGQSLDNAELYQNWLPNTDGEGKELVPADAPLGAMFAVWNDKVKLRYTEQTVHSMVRDSFPVIAQKSWNATNPANDYATFRRDVDRIGAAPKGMK